MLQKISVVAAVLFLCLGFETCKSPEKPDNPEPRVEYRYNVEVIYTRQVVHYPYKEDSVTARFILYDPEFTPSENHYVTLAMNRVGGNTYRCIIPKIIVHPKGSGKGYRKHIVFISDNRISPFTVAEEHLAIQGAYDIEMMTNEANEYVSSWLEFKMSKNESD